MDYRLSGRLNLAIHIFCPSGWQRVDEVDADSPSTQHSFCKKHCPDKGGFPSFLFAKKELTSVTSLSLGFISQCDTSAGVDNSGLLDDQTISVKTGNVASRVSKSNFLDFVGVKPDLALSALEHVGSKALLEFQRD